MTREIGCDQDVACIPDLTPGTTDVELGVPVGKSIRAANFSSVQGLADNEVDSASHGVRAIDRGAASEHDFDSIDCRSRNSSGIRAGAEPTSNHAITVVEEQRAIARLGIRQVTQSRDRKRLRGRRLSRRRTTEIADLWNVGEQINRAGHTGGLNLLTVDGDGRSTNWFHQASNRGAGDDDLI